MKPKIYGVVLNYPHHQHDPLKTIMYIDALCYSACALLTKGINQHGSGIIVGFFGNPKDKQLNNFDVGSSPTFVKNNISICLEINYERNCILTISYSWFETYKFNYNF